VFLAFGYGDKDITMSSIKDGFLVENPLLNKMGFQTGDQILKIDDIDIVNESEIRGNIIEANSITIERDNQIKKIDLPVDFLGQLSDSKNRDLFDLRMPFVVEKILDTSLNKGTDIKKGDIFSSLNGVPVKYIDEIDPVIESFKGQTIKAGFKRGDETITRDLIVDKDGRLDILRETRLSEFAKLGYFDIVTTKYGFFESFGVGITKFKNQVSSYFGQLKKIFNPSTGAYKGVGGFKAIYDIFPDTWSWYAFWKLTAFLSIMLGVLNLLPIPALDGGHVMFLLFEMVSGRKPSEKFLETAQVVGFFILIALVLFANGNDIFKAIFK